MTNWTPLPGIPIPTAQTAGILDQFHQRYRIHAADQPSTIPTWCTFPNTSRADTRIFAAPFFHEFADLCLYVENGQQLFRATPREIQAYFAQRQRWETDWDYYIFATNLSWCIAVTHELMDGSAIFVVGDYPADQYQ